MATLTPEEIDRMLSTIHVEYDYEAERDNGLLDEYMENENDELMPELPLPRVRNVEKIPFKLSELGGKTGKIKEVVAKTMEEPKVVKIPNGGEIEVKFLQNGVEIIKKIQKKIRPVQKIRNMADKLDQYKVKLGIPMGTPLFYRYIRIPISKRNDLNWKGIKRDACIFIYAPSRGSFLFTFSIWNGKDPKKFTKDNARHLCQTRMRTSVSVTVVGIDAESSHLENIRRAINNYSYGLNKRSEEPSIQTTRVTNTQSLKQLATLIQQKFKINEEG